MADDDKELKDQRVVTMMSPSELEAIDDWMFKNRIRSRGEAIRRLTMTGRLFHETGWPILMKAQDIGKILRKAFLMTQEESLSQEQVDQVLDLVDMVYFEQMEHTLEIAAAVYPGFELHLSKPPSEAFKSSEVERARLLEHLIRLREQTSQYRESLKDTNKPDE